jgi:hypothetical protein
MAKNNDEYAPSQIGEAICKPLEAVDIESKARLKPRRVRENLAAGDDMTESPRPPPPKPTAQPFIRQAHSLKGQRVHRRDAVKLTLNPSELGGQQLGQGQLELPLAASRPAKR